MNERQKSNAAAWAWMALILVLPFVAGIICANYGPKSIPTHYYDSASVARIITGAK